MWYPNNCKSYDSVYKIGGMGALYIIELRLEHLLIFPLFTLIITVSRGMLYRFAASHCANYRRSTAAIAERYPCVHGFRLGDISIQSVYRKQYIELYKKGRLVRTITESSGSY